MSAAARVGGTVDAILAAILLMVTPSCVVGHVHTGGNNPPSG